MEAMEYVVIALEEWKAELARRPHLRRGAGTGSDALATGIARLAAREWRVASEKKRLRIWRECPTRAVSRQNNQ
jgi:hypothetical protein